MRDLCEAIELLQAELEDRGSALQEILELLANRCRGDAGRLFSACMSQMDLLGEESFSEIWARSVDGSCAELHGSERDELKRLGTVLGRYELQTQLRELRHYENYLRQKHGEAAQTYPAERRLWLGLGTSAGALIAIVLL